MTGIIIKRLAAAFLLSVPGLLSAQEVIVDTLGGAKSIVSSPAELLKGELSGVYVSATDGNPHGLHNVHVRGVNTLRGDSQPLWIVDGVVIGSSANDNLDAFYLSGGLTSNNGILPDYSSEAYTSPIGSFGWLNPYDIESIEVLKDISATSLYGMRGANGVIIVKTRKPRSGEHNIHLNSNFGVGVAPMKGDAFKTGFVTSHDLGISGVLGTSSFYNVSGFIRYNDAAVRNTGSTVGGLAVSLETAANSILQFGVNSKLAYGDYRSASGANYIGSPSMLLLSRYPDAFEGVSVADYIGSHEDEAVDYRTVNSVWLNINILKTLRLRLSGGFDYQNQTRYIWYGKETPFGKKFNGAAAILNNSLLDYNLRGQLSFERSFAVRHHIQADLSYDFYGDDNRTNAMCGTDYTNPSLKAKGMTSTGSVQSIRKFIRQYAQMGGRASVAYDYDGYAGVSGAVRYDYTIKYDVAGQWLPSCEAFVDLKKIFASGIYPVSTFRLTGGYGWAGREKLMPYQYMASYIFDVPEVEAGSEPYFDGLDRLLSKEYNVGFDLGFMEDRYRLSVKYYDKNTSDLFSVYSFGKKISGQWVRTGNWYVTREYLTHIRNNGLELDADFMFIRNSTLTWTARLNAAYNLSRAFDVDRRDVNRTAGVKDGMPVAEFADGRSPGEILGHDTLPKVFGGFGTTLSLFGFTLDADFSGAAGFWLLNGAGLLQKDACKITEKDMEKGDYLRLDNLTLSYEIPMDIKWIEGIRVNLSARNLATFTRYSGGNPDVNCFGTTIRSYGVDYGSYPLCRQVILGIGLRF